MWDCKGRYTWYQIGPFQEVTRFFIGRAEGRTKDLLGWVSGGGNLRARSRCPEHGRVPYSHYDDTFHLSEGPEA